MEGGHYYSYIKDRAKGKWFEFNDTQVKPFDVKDLPEETFGGEGKGGNYLSNTTDFIGDAVFSRSRNAYFIIYQRKHPLPLPTAQIVDPNHEYVKGIPKSVYQHIWDENMLFMKRLYFFDIEYLNFVRDFLSLSGCESKQRISHSSLTKELEVKSEAAKMLNVTKDQLKVHISIQSADMFSENKDDIEFKVEDKQPENMEIDHEDDFHKGKIEESSLNNIVFGQEDKVLVDLRKLDVATIERAKAMLVSLKDSEVKDLASDEPADPTTSDPSLGLLKFGTLFAFKVKEQVKDRNSFISLLQQLNSMYEVHADG